MILFHSENVADGILTLTREDSIHCARVLRHRLGDRINATDGMGAMYECVITSDNPECVAASVLAVHEGWNARPYRLTAAVCPTKNNERFEWFVEKAVEIGVDVIVPLIGQRSERKVYKTQRAKKLVVSAAKQSLKSSFPVVEEPVSVKDFLGRYDGSNAQLKMIACCFETDSVQRLSISQALASSDAKDVTIMIGPEGDFSPEEALSAISRGFVPVHLGLSRMRTETAALFSVAMVYENRSAF